MKSFSFPTFLVAANLALTGATDQNQIGALVPTHVRDRQLANTCSADKIVLQEIPGAFEIQVVARYDNVAGGGHWQRIFDFGNGAGKDNIWMGQESNKPHMRFGVYQNGKSYWIRAYNAIKQGETATWNVGVDSNGLMWMNKNGVRVAQRNGEKLKPNVKRANKYVAMSNWAAGGGHHLKGAVLGLHIMNEKERSKGNHLNVIPKMIEGPFSVSGYVLFDTLNKYSWQRVFDFGNGAGKDNVWFGQVGTSADMALSVYQDTKETRFVAKNVIEVGKMDHWAAGIDCSGRVWIKKNCEVVASGEGLVPDNIVRKNMLVGNSNWDNAGQLDGSVFGLKFDTTENCNLGTCTGETIALKEIPGAFEIEVIVRYDDITGGGQWQRTFDFGNGAAQDNIWMGQESNKPNMMFGIFQNKKHFYIKASNAIIKGETATWNVGIDDKGFMYMKKYGKTVAQRTAEKVKPNVIRKNKYVAMSNWAHGGGHHLKGAVLGLHIMNKGQPSTGQLVNFAPGRIYGAFSFSVFVLFDKKSTYSWQRVFDFGNGAGQDNVWFGQVGTSTDIALSVYKGTAEKRLVAKGVIDFGVQDHWEAGVECDGSVWIKKNCKIVAEGTGHTIPESMERKNMLIGNSNWPDAGQLDGSIMGLRFENPGCVDGKEVECAHPKVYHAHYDETNARVKAWCA